MPPKRWGIPFLAVLMIVWVMIASAQNDNQPVLYDLVIHNGRVINPETNLDQTGLNIGIYGAKIAALTADPIAGKKVIAAGGLVVAPGFIDLLSYDPNPVGVWNKLADGITTNIGMHGATDNPGQWFSFFEKLNARERLPLHFGGSFFYTKARLRFGLGRNQPANSKQIEALYQIGEAALKDGCLGISISLEYVPGISAAECLSMMKLAQKYNVAVYYHVRYSDMETPGTNIDALNEVIYYAGVSGAAVHIDHLNSTGGTFSMKESLALLNHAKAGGLDISACMYPYNYWATYLDSARFDPGWQNRFHIDYHDLQLGGSPERLTPESYEFYRKQGKLVDAFAIPEEDIREALRCPWLMLGSDGILEPGFNNHPRASGMCARLIGHYVRDEKVISLRDALAKLTILPARRLEAVCPALKNKGRIAVGADADIVIFDFDKIIDRATPEHPEYTSGGIEYVLVDGAIVKDPQGFNQNIRNGKALKSEFIPARYSKKTLAWKTCAIPLVNYRKNDYFDLQWLHALGCRLREDKMARLIHIIPGSQAETAKSGADTAKAGEIPRRFPDGQIVQERGYSAAIDASSRIYELISIGARHFVPAAIINEKVFVEDLLRDKNYNK